MAATLLNTFLKNMTTKAQKEFVDMHTKDIDELDPEKYGHPQSNIKKDESRIADKAPVSEEMENLHEHKFNVGKFISHKETGKAAVILGKSSDGSIVRVKYNDGKEKEHTVKELARHYDLMKESEQIDESWKNNRDVMDSVNVAINGHRYAHDDADHVYSLHYYNKPRSEWEKDKPEMIAHFKKYGLNESEQIDEISDKNLTKWQSDKISKYVHKQGKESKLKGRKKFSNPHTPGTESYRIWNLGYEGKKIDEEQIDEISKRTLDSYLSKQGEELAKSFNTKNDRLLKNRLHGGLLASNRLRGNFLRKKQDGSGNFEVSNYNLTKEEMENLEELSKATLKSYVKKSSRAAEKAWEKADKEEDKSMSTDGEKYPEKQKRHMDNASKLIDIWRKRDSGLKAANSRLGKK